jgi:CubicO group peptidase (beta-lactamase class C family)
MSMLVDDNEKYPQIQWNTPINQIIRDDFVLEDDYATSHVTIEDALSHRSGFQGLDNAFGHPKTSIKDVVRSLRHHPLNAEPRTMYQYSNAMYVAATHVIETVTGRRLGDLMREWIWEPLEMKSTFICVEDARNSNDELAHGYKYLYDYNNGEFEEVEWANLESVSGAGAVITSALDYAKWARAILTDSTPLSKKGIEAIFTPRTLMPTLQAPYTGPRSYALGWRLGVYQGQWFFEHSGGVAGFGAQLLIFPDLNFSAVALGNTAGTANFVDQRLLYHLLDEKLNVPQHQRFDWDKA